MSIPPETDADLPSWLRPFANSLTQRRPEFYALYAVLSIVVLGQVWRISPLPTPIMLTAGLGCYWAAELLPPHRLRPAALLRLLGLFIGIPAQLIVLVFLLLAG